MTVCPSCNAVNVDGARYCQNCGRSLALNPAGDGQPPVNADALKAFVRGTATETRILGVCTILVFIALLMPWYSVSLLGFSASVNGFHRWGWLTFLGLVVAAVATTTLARAGRSPNWAAERERRVLRAPLIAGILETIGAIAFLVDVESSSDGLGGPSAGLYLALLAGLVTAAVGGWPFLSGQRRTPRDPR